LVSLHIVYPLLNVECSFSNVYPSSASGSTRTRQ
jgi:hypothetical protein